MGRKLRFREIRGLARMFTVTLVSELDFNPCPDLKGWTSALASHENHLGSFENSWCLGSTPEN